ncbi:site-specific integrase [Actinomadura graeca]|uniref:Site-specific integrase n=1 Tax=Actinomadura graeca TaxID=2750812 RepID=A0ABX8RA00_9ACTN|nr:site-specific integrase [Actinomadura graeca]QXJ25808.1 site-specific integrase [Actinomadura graeca]
MCGRAVVPLADTALGEAAAAFLVRRDLDADTLRSYGQMLRRLRRELGETAPLAQVTADQADAVFTAAWNEAAPRTWNRHRSALRWFTTWAADRSWVTTDLAALIERRPEKRDRTRAIDRRTVEALLAVLTMEVGNGAARSDDLEMREGLRVRCGLRHLHRTPGGPHAPP